MDEAVHICARLLREGTVPRSELPDLDHPDVRREVEHRLGAVGLQLATSAYSEHVGLRLSPDVVAHSDFDSASNLGLRSDACALLVIAWARLVLQKRTARDTRDVPGQRALLPEDQAAAAREYIPQVRISTIAREFGPIIGSRTHIKALVTRLRRLGFLAGRGEVIEPGPLLEHGIDGEKMVGFIRREVLAGLLQAKTPPAEQDRSEDESIDTQIVQALHSLGGSAKMKELAGAVGERADRVRTVLADLIAQGKIRRTGERANTKYHVAI
jgi:hypothetical protein